MRFRLFASVALSVAFASVTSAQTLPSARYSNDPPPAVSSASRPYHPISAKQRLRWFAESTVGPETLAAGVFTAGFGTARDAPKEYGSTWKGFAQRYGVRLTGISTGNAMEASLGAIWGEDPRYFPSYGQPFKGRLLHVVIMTFVAHDREGHVMPAYARYISTPGNNFLSNTWRADSEATTKAALTRTVLGFAGLMGKNAFAELWPSVKRTVFRTHAH